MPPFSAQKNEKSFLCFDNIDAHPFSHSLTKKVMIIKFSLDYQGGYFSTKNVTNEPTDPVPAIQQNTSQLSISFTQIESDWWNESDWFAIGIFMSTGNMYWKNFKLTFWMK